MSKVKLKHSNKYDGIRDFAIFIVLSIVIGFFVVKPTQQPEKFDYQHAPIEDFRLSNQTISFSVKSLGNKQFNIPAPADVKADSQLFVAYRLKGEKLDDIDTVSYNDQIIWTNPN